MTIASDYLRIGVEALRRTGTDAVGGVMTACGGGWFGEAAAAAARSRLSLEHGAGVGSEERLVAAVAPGFWPRATFERVGLFDEELGDGQDVELTYRLRAAGGRSLFVPTMCAWYQVHQSVATLVRAHYQRGQWMVRVLQKHPAQLGLRVCALPGLVAVALVLQLTAPLFPAAAIALRLLVWTYLIAALIGAATVSGKRGPTAVGATVLAVVCTHAAAGIGFWSGLVKYADRWRTPGPAAPRLAPVMPADPR